MAGADAMLMGVGYASPSTRTPMGHLQDLSAPTELVTVAEEVPIALVYNGRPYVVVMGTPADLEDLAFGFSATEGVIGEGERVEHVDVVRASHGIELQVQVPAAAASRLELRTRALVARTSCGLCGLESIGDAMRVPPVLPHTLEVTRDALWRAGRELAHEQTLNNETNAVHAAGWADAFGELHVVREDVGRHNALDKVLGALVRQGRRAEDGFVIVTSRASYEMVQKAASRGVELIAAISRPTGLAIRFAQASGTTLVGLLRGETANVYTSPERIR